MIQEIYLKRAVKIRKEYLQITSDIERYESLSKQFIDVISDRIKDLQLLDSNLSSKKIQDPSTAENELKRIVIQMEDDINRIDKSINDLNNRMDLLREDENNLYQEIKRTYSDLSDDKIKEIIKSHFKKLNLT